MRDLGSIPRGILMWNRDSPVSIVSLHWWPRRDWSLWSRLRRPLSRLSLGCHADNVIIPLDLKQLFCTSFTLAAPSGFTTDIVGCWGGALWWACNLTAFTSCLAGPVDYLFSSHHEGPGGHLCETWILLLALSLQYKIPKWTWTWTWTQTHPMEMDMDMKIFYYVNVHVHNYADIYIHVCVNCACFQWITFNAYFQNC